jgi:hypothetical protein
LITRLVPTGGDAWLIESERGEPLGKLLKKGVRLFVIVPDAGSLLENVKGGYSCAFHGSHPK